MPAAEALGCLVLTKQGTPLVNYVPPGSCADVQVQPVCGLLVALHSLADADTLCAPLVELCPSQRSAFLSCPRFCCFALHLCVASYPV